MENIKSGSKYFCMYTKNKSIPTDDSSPVDG